MDYLVFISICLVATFSPGPAVFLSIKNSIAYGVLKSISGILGNVAAMLTLASLSAVGLGAVILSSQTLFTIIQFIGGAYLIFLGIKSWRSAKVLSNQSTTLVAHKSCRVLFSEAYLVGMSNPKAIAFYTALFPQFLDIEQSVAPQFALLAGTFAAFSFSALLAYALMAKMLKRQLMRESVTRIFHRVTGGIFVGYGSSLLLSSSLSRS